MRRSKYIHRYSSLQIKGVNFAVFKSGLIILSDRKLVRSFILNSLSNVGYASLHTLNDLESVELVKMYTMTVLTKILFLIIYLLFYMATKISQAKYKEFEIKFQPTERENNNLLEYVESAKQMYCGNKSLFFSNDMLLFSALSRIYTKIT